MFPRHGWSNSSHHGECWLSFSIGAKLAPTVIRCVAARMSSACAWSAPEFWSGLDAGYGGAGGVGLVGD